MRSRVAYRGRGRALILETVRLAAPITRVEIAAATGLTSAAVSQHVSKLIAQGLVRESRRRAPKRGQPPVELVIQSGAAYMLGVHLEYSQLNAVLVDLDGTVLGESTRAHTRPEPGEVVESAAAMCQALLRQQGLEREHLLGVGLASVGPIDLGGGTVNAPLHFSATWRRVPLRQGLADALGVAVFLDNNATAAAIGEYWYGGGRRYADFLFVHLGVGIGGGLFLGGRVYRGSSFNAGEFGHMIVGAPRSGSAFAGTHGSLESYASLFALEHDLGRAVAENLAEAFAEGDEALLGWLEQAGRYFAHAVVSADNLLDLDAVIFGGLLPTALNTYLVGRVSDYRSTFDNLRGRPRRARCVPAETQGNSAALGAAMLPVYDAFVHAPSEAGVLRSVGGGGP